MGLKATLENVHKLDALIEPMLREAKVPGAAVVIVSGDEILFAKGYGCRNLENELPATPETIYPIASTTKAMNATLLGMLVDESRLAWDVPVQEYLPRFRLGDPVISAQVSLRDLITMRTGLPRHDWMWIEHPITRADLVTRLRHLDLSAGFRERFQYNNLTVTAAGHVAEVVTGHTWEDLLQKRILGPLGMSRTGFGLPATENVTQSYHENGRRKLVLTRRLKAEVTAPSGGSIHSNVLDMARWLSFNLRGGSAGSSALIQRDTLALIHSAQMATAKDPASPTPSAVYGMGWFVDTYHGQKHLSHGGYLHDVSSEVNLFPEHGIGIVSFINLGGPGIARFMNLLVFDHLMGFQSTQTLQERLAIYEARILETNKRNGETVRVENTAPSHALSSYKGTYEHPAYGKVEIHLRNQELVFQRSDLILPLEHWHYDTWVAKENDQFLIHISHGFDPTSRLLFDTNENGEIVAVSIRLEPTVAPIRFVRQ